MIDRAGRELLRLKELLHGRVSEPGEYHYTAATAIWAKPAGRMPRPVAHYRSTEDVQAVIQAARNCDRCLSIWTTLIRLRSISLAGMTSRKTLSRTPFCGPIAASTSSKVRAWLLAIVRNCFLTWKARS
jgi:hypothetical protein